MGDDARHSALQGDSRPRRTPQYHIRRTGLGNTLSSREREVLQLVALGLSNRAIAARLFLSEQTIKSHMKKILLKTETDCRAGAVAVGFRRGDVT